MSKKVRVRFAPSPTGGLHIGGVRTALYNYLYAKKHHGDFILRIEDTDQNRYVEGAEDYIVNALAWCGLTFDESPKKGGDYGPYRQSERKAIYLEYAEKLVELGKAYYAFDTTEELAEQRKELESSGRTFIYNSKNRQALSNSLSMTEEEFKSKRSSGANYVIRFLTPEDETIELYDSVRGSMQIDSNILDDKVLFKSDGMPTYHLANIVDDHLMKITHVIRGEEWLPSLALHKQLYDAFGWDTPEFSHLPLILKPTGKGKLSKRDGEKGGFPIFPISWKDSIGYREAGYFPEAVINFLALLGWNPGTEQELFSLDQLVEVFSIERVHSAGARFNLDKTKWMNQQYMQIYDEKQLGEAFAKELYSQPKGMLSKFSIDYIVNVVTLIKERAVFISDFWELSNYFFIAPLKYNSKAIKKQWKPDTAAILKQSIDIFQEVREFNSEAVETDIKSWIANQNLSLGKVMPPLRLVLVGDMKGPHIFDVIALIGKNETISRIETAIKKLG